jgi:hypothetical protein
MRGKPNEPNADFTALSRVGLTLLLVVLIAVLTACAAPAAAPAPAPAQPAASAAPAEQKPAESATEAPKEEAKPTEESDTTTPAGAAEPAEAERKERATPVEPTSVAAAAAAPTDTAQPTEETATEAPAATQEAPAVAAPPVPVPPEPTQTIQLDLVATPTAIPPTAGAAIEPTATAVPLATPAPTQMPSAAPTATAAPTPLPLPAPITPEATESITAPKTKEPEILPSIVQTQPVEARIVELEWPPNMRLGDSDIVRLALIPSTESYTITTEFEGSQTITQSVAVKRPSGFDLSATARLDGIGFNIGPQAEQRSSLPIGEPVDWRWTVSPREAGQHRLALSLRLLWTPQAGNPEAPRESLVFSKGLNVQVHSILGMTLSQASVIGLAGLALGSLMSALALFTRRSRSSRVSAEVMKTAKPNASLAIEPQPGIQLAEDELQLLRALFQRYSRVVIEREFRSGYSGARTLLALPIRADGRADAFTIAKMGERSAIQQEFDNYETFVRDTLPPMTARIQEAPVTVAPAHLPGKAVLRYTFIGEQGRMPVSLRETLLADPDPALLYKLFDSFGPNWWMQHKPYTFRMAQEYDRMLPAHLVVEPIESRVRSPVIDGATPPKDVRFNVGDLVQLKNFPTIERRADGISFALSGAPANGQAPFRIRYNSVVEPRKGAPFTCRVTGTRQTLLQEYVAGMDRLGLPDPLDKLPAILNTSVTGTQSTIHGDLNLENALAGPGGFVWLIDFASTRDGHPLYDFAHLQADIIARVIAPQMPDPRDFLALLNEVSRLESSRAPAQHSFAGLMLAIRDIAQRCSFNPQQLREFDLASFISSLGALKYTNLDRHQHHMLYLHAAYVSQALY